VLAPPEDKAFSLPSIAWISNCVQAPFSIALGAPGLDQSDALLPLYQDDIWIDCVLHDFSDPTALEVEPAARQGVTPSGSNRFGESPVSDGVAGKGTVRSRWSFESGADSDEQGHQQPSSYLQPGVAQHP
jgi:hypothetical protein